MKSLITRASVVLILMTCSACCSLFNWSKRGDVTLVSQGIDADLEVYNNDHLIGKERLNADEPAQMAIDACDWPLKSHYRFVFSSRGFESEAYELDSSFSWMFWLNVPFVFFYGVGAGGMAIDAVLGQEFRFDDNKPVINVTLEPKNEEKEF